MNVHPDVAAVIDDAAWLAHRYDAVSDKVHFVHASRNIQQQATFLVDEFLAGASAPRVIRRADAVSAINQVAPQHFIFHSAYCCSTLLARAFDIEGTSHGLKEPTILNDISGWRRRGGQPGEVTEILRSALTLLGRPFQPGEHNIIKPSNVVNALAPAILAAAPHSQALFLYTPLPNYLASIAKKGMWGRLWARDLFVKLTKDGLTDYGFSPEEILQQTDLQIAAIGWIAQHRLFASMVSQFGAKRIRTLESEKLLAEPHKVLGKLVAHFDLSMSTEMMNIIIDSGLFGKHSKTGTDFNATSREAEHRKHFEMHGDEIEKVSIWAEAVAKSAGQDLHLSAALN